MIVLEAPTLTPALQLWPVVIFVQQKDAIEAIIAFIEAVLGLVACPMRMGGYTDETQLQHGKLLRPKVQEVTPSFVEALFRLMAGVPTRYVQESIPLLVELVRDCFQQEFPMWLQS